RCAALGALLRWCPPAIYLYYCIAARAGSRGGPVRRPCPELAIASAAVLPRLPPRRSVTCQVRHKPEPLVAGPRGTRTHRSPIRARRRWHPGRPWLACRTAGRRVRPKTQAPTHPPCPVAPPTRCAEPRGG